VIVTNLTSRKLHNYQKGGSLLLLAGRDGGSAPCGRRHLAPGFNPGYAGPPISMVQPLQGRRHGWGRNAFGAWRPRSPLKGLGDWARVPNTPG
jgi:hypothetical protein